MASKAENVVSYQQDLETIDDRLRPLTDRQFKFIVDLIHKRSGIRFDASKKNLAIGRLSRRLRSKNIDSWDKYLKKLVSDESEMEYFVNLLTTNKTHFFRENKHFEYLSQKFLPSLIEQGLKEAVFWVGATSTGQEVYSLLMVVEEFKRINGVDLELKILATDIDTAVLSKADAGIYQKELVEKNVPSNLIARYFLKGTGSHEGFYRFNPEYTRNIKFRYHNLCDFSGPLPLSFHAIFVRNVLIYFDPETVKEVTTKLFNHLKPKGALFLGHCEAIQKMHWDLESPSQSVYIRRE